MSARPKPRTRHRLASLSVTELGRASNRRISIRAAVSPAVYERLMEVVELEGPPGFKTKALPRVVGSMLLLGLGVYRRLQEHPALMPLKDLSRVELLTLIDFRSLRTILTLQEEEAQRWIDREDRRNRERAGDGERREPPV